MNKAGRSVLELLYRCYDGGEDSKQIRELMGKIDNALGPLPFAQKDAIFTTIVKLCVEYQHDAFLDGLRMGTRLIWELTDNHQKL